ncbi:hypothetical protein GIB67_037757 [Kingdonia uniflora]|uniref:RING-type domain-containing protein n=1 Tax=Kingdonia uniflora TaxID=39325 RepID=A0A7J7LV54_9MAGN|nr:hypothetical protein GIB67_037757 [Kingdonia uniflora]
MDFPKKQSCPSALVVLTLIIALLFNPWNDLHWNSNKQHCSQSSFSIISYVNYVIIVIHLPSGTERMAMLKQIQLGCGFELKVEGFSIIILLLSKVSVSNMSYKHLTFRRHSHWLYVGGGSFHVAPNGTPGADPGPRVLHSPTLLREHLQFQLVTNLRHLYPIPANGNQLIIVLVLSFKFHNSELQKMKKASPNPNTSYRRERFRQVERENMRSPKHYITASQKKRYYITEDEKCGLCKRHMSEESSCRSHNISYITAVLSCRHVFHAECLDRTTTKTEIEDPPCPVCMKTTDAFEPISEQEWVSFSDESEEGISEQSSDQMEATSSRKQSLPVQEHFGSRSASIKGNVKLGLKDFLRMKKSGRIGSSLPIHLRPNFKVAGGRK